MIRNAAMMVVMLVLSACGDNFVPREKTAQYDPVTGELVMPYPCADWSQSETGNVLNEKHSNFGCAVNTNSALQVAEPSDLYRGHGANTPDIEVTTGVVSAYRAGKIPQPLAPMQSDGGSTGGASQ